MFTLENDKLQASFSYIGKDLGVRINFQRTLRLPDDGRKYDELPELGSFPLRHIEDCNLWARQHPNERGGFVVPIFQTDALWLAFDSFGSLANSICPSHLESRDPLCNLCELISFPSLYTPSLPIALKIRSGKIDVVSGKKWSTGLSSDPQDYVVTPLQRWLDGFSVTGSIVRQFVAMPLGQEYAVEEQLDPENSVGVLQIEAFPMKKDLFIDMAIDQARRNKIELEGFDHITFCSSNVRRRIRRRSMDIDIFDATQQYIYEDPYGLDAWDTDNHLSCFVMLANANQWMSMTGEEPPLSPVSAKKYSKAGLPWFDYYDGDRAAIKSAKRLGKIKTIRQLARERRSGVWPEVKAKFDYVMKKIKRSRLSDGSW